MTRRIIKKRKTSKKKQKKQRKKRDNVNMMNIGKLMRKYSGGKSISPSAVKEMIDRLDIFLQSAMPDISRIAEANGCKKFIKEYEDLEHPEKSQAHVTWYFSAVSNNIENIAQINKSHRWELVKIKKGKEIKQ